MHLISTEQQNEEGNTLSTDPPTHLGNFSKQFCVYFLDPSWHELKAGLLTFVYTLLILPYSVDSIKIKNN